MPDQLSEADCPYFREFRDRIAFDFNMLGATDHEIWEMIPSKLQSFRLKGGLAKQSRWFSWNEQAAVQLQEFHAAKMLFEWYFPGDTDAGESGLKALKGSLTAEVWEDAHIIYRVQMPMWNYFSEQIHNIKHPEHKITECMNVANDAWMQHPHLQGLADAFNAHTWVDLEPWVGDKDSFLHKALTYASGCLSNRCQTMAKFSAPPECWIGLLASDNNVVNATRTVLLKEFQWFKTLQSSTAPFAQELSEDIGVAFDLPSRYMCLLCHFDLASGIDLQRLLVGGFADSKVVEDIHQSCRVAVNPGSNKRISGASLQLVCQLCGVLEARELGHPCALTEEQFLDKWPDVKDDFNCKAEFRSSTHSLPKRYSQILCKKQWRTLGEDALRTAYGGWQWMLHYCRNRLFEHGICLQAWVPGVCRLILFPFFTQ